MHKSNSGFTKYHKSFTHPYYKVFIKFQSSSLTLDLLIGTHFLQYEPFFNNIKLMLSPRIFIEKYSYKFNGTHTILLYQAIRIFQEVF